MCLTWTDIRQNRSMPEVVVIPQRLRELALLRRVRDRIDREYAQPLDVEALARGVKMPSGHLSREFRRAYGESPYSYVVARRIERAGEGTPLCGADPVPTPIRNREAPVTEPQLA